MAVVGLGTPVVGDSPVDVKRRMCYYCVMVRVKDLNEIIIRFMGLEARPNILLGRRLKRTEKWFFSIVN